MNGAIRADDVTEFDVTGGSTVSLLFAASAIVLGLRKRRFSARYLTEPEPEPVLAAGGGS